MNVRGLANRLVRRVNPNVTGTLKRSNGATKGTDYSRAPTYTDVTPVTFQVQPLSGGELRHADAMNIQGVKRAIGCNERMQGANRPDQKGGDLVVIAAQDNYVTMSGGASDTFLIVEVPEDWGTSGWCRAIGVLQK